MIFACAAASAFCSVASLRACASSLVCSICFCFKGKVYCIASASAFACSTRTCACASACFTSRDFCASASSSAIRTCFCLISVSVPSRSFSCSFSTRLARPPRRRRIHLLPRVIQLHAIHQRCDEVHPGIQRTRPRAPDLADAHSRESVGHHRDRQRQQNRQHSRCCEPLGEPPAGAHERARRQRGRLFALLCRG